MSELTDDELRKGLRHRAGLIETTPTDAYLMMKAEQRIRQLVETCASDAAVLICPERDGRCPHGPDCTFAIDRYSCNMEGSRNALRAAASTSTEGAGVIEEAQTIAQRMRQIVQDVWDKREGYTDDQAWTDLHGQAMRLLEWDVRSRALNPPAPKVTTDEAEEREVEP